MLAEISLPSLKLINYCTLAFYTLAGEGGKRLGSEVGSILKPTDADHW